MASNPYSGWLSHKLYHDGRLVPSAVQLSEHSRGSGNLHVHQDFGLVVAIEDLLQPEPRSGGILRQAMTTIEETAPVTRGEIGGITQSNRRGTRRGKGVLFPTESVARPPQVWEDL